MYRSFWGIYRARVVCFVLLLIAFPALAEQAANHSQSAQSGQSGQALNCSDAYASPSGVTPHRWGRFSKIRIKGLNNVKRTEVLCIRQDEPRSYGQYADGAGIGNARAWVRRSRSSDGDGRVYHIGFKAWAKTGGSCTGAVTVEVPNGHEPTVDGGPLYDSVRHQKDCSMLTGNQPPVIESTPITEIKAGDTYQYPIQATDADGDTLTYSLETGPAGMQIDVTTGELSWVPLDSQVGGHEIRIAVNDGHHPAVTQVFELEVVPDPGECHVGPSSQEVHFADFSQLGDWTLLGSAQASQHRLRLTDRQAHKRAAAYYNRPIQLRDDNGASQEPLSFYFRLQMHQPTSIREHDGKGADGLTFVLAAANDQLGLDGGRLGYEGMTNSVAIELDTWRNRWDPNGNHIGINTHGEVHSLKTARLYSRLNNGHVKHVWINYQPGTNQLSVWLSHRNHRPHYPVLRKTLNLPAILQSDRAYLGFTSATGDAAQIHDILSARFQAPFVAEDCEEETLSFTSSPVTQATAGERYTYTAEATSSLNQAIVTYSLSDAPTNATIDAQSGEIHWTPALTEAGSTVSFTVLATSDQGASAEQTVSVDVLAPPNQSPVANDLDLSTNEDESLNLTLQATDPDGDALDYTVLSTPEHGTLSGTAPNLTYTPNDNFVGTDQFSYEASDGQANSNTARVMITIHPVNDAPIADTQTLNGIEDTPLPITLTGSDLEGEPLSYILNTQPSLGILSGTAPNIVYTPNANIHGTDSFSFYVNDGELDSAAATITITIAPQNDIPDADDQSYNTDEDTSVNLTLVGNDVDGDPLSYRIINQPQHGTIAGTEPDLVYTPQADFHGTDTLTYVVNDGTVDSQTATVTFTVSPVNDAPTANAQTLSSDEDTALSLTLSGSDVDGDNLAYRIESQPTHGQLSGERQAWTYTPNENFNGADSFTIVVNDGHVDSEAATVSITVNPVNDVPVAMPASYTLDENSSIDFILRGSDIDGDSLDYQLVTQPDHGDISGQLPNITYTPKADFSGTDQLTFTVSDQQAVSVLAIIDFTVNAINNAPVINSQPALATIVKQQYTYTVEATDPDNDPLSYELLTSITGMAIDPQTGKLQWTPADAQVGSHNVTVRVTDVHGEFVEQTFQLLVVSDEPAITHEGTDFWLTFMKNFRGSDQQLSLYISSQQATSGYIEIPAMAQTIPFSVAANSVETITFEDPDAQDFLTAGYGAAVSTRDGDVEKIQQTGIHIVAESPVTVYGLNYVTNTTDGFLIFPTNALGHEYTVAGYVDRKAAKSGTNQVAVLATQDNTVITVTPAHNLPRIHDIWQQEYAVLTKKGEPYQKTLNRGESYYISDYVAGSQVASTAPIAVFSGNSCQSVPHGYFACDHMVEQIPPNGSLGNRYFTHPFADRALGDTFFIIATSDNSLITINDTHTVTLNKGEIYETLISEPSEISSNHAILVSQFSHSNSYDYAVRDRKDISVDPFLVNISAAANFLNRYTFTTPTTGFRWNYINIVAKTTDIQHIRLDGSPLDPTRFQVINGSEYASASIPVDIGIHSITSNEAFGLTIYGYDDFDSYGFQGGQSLGNADLIQTVALISPDTLISSVGETACSQVKALSSASTVIANAPLSYEIIGDNKNAGLAFTNVLGIAEICYDGTFAGNDTLVVTTDHSNTVEVQLEWTLGNASDNLAPAIVNHPTLQAEYGQVYASQITARDPEGGDLIYALSHAPEGMSIDAVTGDIRWSVPTDVDRVTFTVLVTDSQGASIEQQYQLSTIDYNHAPVITSSPILSVPAHSFYSYSFESYDQDRQAYGSAYHDSLRAYFETRPDGLSAFGSTFSNGRAVYDLNWNVGDLANTDQDVVVVITDGRGGVAKQSFTIHVTPNQPAIINSIPDESARIGRKYSYALDVTDPEGENSYYFTYRLKTYTPGMSINRRDFSWTPTAADIGTHNVTLEVVDNAGNITEQSWTITVLDQPNIAPVFDSTPPDTAWVNQLLSYTVETSDADDDPMTLSAVTLPTGATFDTTTNTLTWTPTADQVGEVTIELDVSDSYETATQSFVVTVSQDSTSPVIDITSLEQADVITEPVQLVGTITDDQLANWRVFLERDGSGAQSEIAQGTEAVQDSAFAVIDPTLLMNGVYTATIVASDASGNQTTQALSFIVEGNLKVGNFSVTFEDLNIPMAGIPIQVTRTYDSRQRNELGDFGYGWTIDYQNVDIQETRTPGLAWEMNEYATGPQGILTNYCVEPVGKPQVVVTLPDGKVERFAISAEPHCSTGVPIFDVTLKFTPESGTTSELEAIDNGVVRLVNDNLVVLGDNQVANPDHYKLTTKAGYIYTLDQGFGIEQIETPNGHTLTYTDNGIMHSAGKSVLFNRDSEGLIYRVTAPSGININYTYLSNNDLSYVRNEHSAYTTFTYNHNHGLVDITDAEGNKIVKNIYDDDGRLIAQEDNEGNRTDFNHDLAGKQSSVTDRLGRTTLYYYDDRGNVTSEVDALGQITTYTYDQYDNQLSKTNALGHTSSATYDDRYNQLTQTDELGHITQFSYNQRGQELTITDALGNQYQNTYDTYGNLLSIEDPEGNIAGQNINAQGLVSLRRDAEGHETTYTYDGSGNVLTETDAEGHTVVNEYDANNNKTRETTSRTDQGTVKTEHTDYNYQGIDRPYYTRDYYGRTILHEYDRNGRETRTTDKLGRRTEMTYDAYGRLLETEYPDGTTETSTYDAEGNLLSETDRKGRTTSYLYDALNRLIETTYPDNSTTQTVYDAIGQVIEEIDERGNSTTHTYDAAGRRISTTDALDNTTSFEYDANGNLIKQTDAKGHVTASVYNALDQRIQTIFDDGSTIETEYDKLGRQIETIDQNGRRTQYAYDGLSRLIEVTDALDQITSYTYDEVGNKLTQTDAEGRTTSWRYDALGRELSRTLPLGQIEDFTYDFVGNRTVHNDFNRNRHSFRFESATDRLEQESWFDGTSVSYTYDNTGMRIGASDSTGDYSYTYDDRDRLITETKPDGTTLEYTYDAAGNKLSLTTTLNGTVTETTYTYDILNRLKTVTDADGVTTYHYDEVGNRKAVDYSNGTRTEYTYDSLNRLTQVRHKDAIGNTLASFEYTLDATGRRTQITEANGRVTDYSYDELYRLTDETITDSVNGNYSATYEYDKVGNRTYSTIDGVQTAYTYDKNDRLTQQGGTTYTYDDNGNTLSESIDAGLTSYQWDSQNRLIQSSETNSFGLTTSTFTYDIDNNRINKTVDDNGNLSDITYIVDNNQDYAQVLHEVNTSTLNTEVSYTYGGDLLAQNRAGQLQIYHYDGLGSTRLLTDNNGSTTNAYSYDAFGDLLIQTGFSENNYLFTGEQFDRTLNQYYLRARYYDAAIGRFTQLDSFPGFEYDSPSLHKYTYTHNDPVNNIDPSGHISLGSIGTALNVVGHLAKTTVKAGGTSALRFAQTLSRFGKATVRVGKTTLIRVEYMKRVRGLKKLAVQLRKNGKTPEEIAKIMNRKRRALGRLFKNATDPQTQKNAFERNIRVYGDKWGPTWQYLRNRGKSWEEIIESSTRPNSSLQELIRIFFGR